MKNKKCLLTNRKYKEEECIMTKETQKMLDDTARSPGWGILPDLVKELNKGFIPIVSVKQELLRYNTKRELDFNSVVRTGKITFLPVEKAVAYVDDLERNLVLFCDHRVEDQSPFASHSVFYAPQQ